MTTDSLRPNIQYILEHQLKIVNNVNHFSLKCIYCVLIVSATITISLLLNIWLNKQITPTPYE